MKFILSFLQCIDISIEEGQNHYCQLNVMNNYLSEFAILAMSLVICCYT